MCVVDSLTKRAHFIPTHTTINAEATALLFLKEVWKHHGTPRVVVLDRGPQFVAGFKHKLYKLLGIKLAFGLTNSLATFQTMMNEIFQDLIAEGVVSVYLDDILIFTNSLEEHCRITCLG
jgi:hypothetical protein